jgi:hypothetical protein
MHLRYEKIQKKFEVVSSIVDLSKRKMKISDKAKSAPLQLHPPTPPCLPPPSRSSKQFDFSEVELTVPKDILNEIQQQIIDHSRS